LCASSTCAEEDCPLLPINIPLTKTTRDLDILLEGGEEEEGEGLFTAERGGDTKSTGLSTTFLKIETIFSVIHISDEFRLD
jgi:hypothetical protein